jgi:hypothetical protein
MEEIKMTNSKLDKIFVKRYRVGIKGNKEADAIINAQTPTLAKKQYAFKRGIRVTPKILIKKWNG